MVQSTLHNLFVHLRLRKHPPNSQRLVARPRHTCLLIGAHSEIQNPTCVASQGRRHFQSRIPVLHNTDGLMYVGIDHVTTGHHSGLVVCGHYPQLPSGYLRRDKIGNYGQIYDCGPINVLL
jgi:hypothetical protein